MRPPPRFLLALLATALIAGSPLAAGDAPKQPGAGTTLDLAFIDLRFKTVAPKQIKQAGSDTEMPSFNDQIPERIRDMNAKRVSIHGFMMPTQLEGKGVREFIIVSSPLVCCYGQTPDVNEYIVVKMVGKPAPLLENVPLRFEGVLKVGDIYENGYWTGLYALDCDDVQT